MPAPPRVRFLLSWAINSATNGKRGTREACRPIEKLGRVYLRVVVNIGALHERTERSADIAELYTRTTSVCSYIESHAILVLRPPTIVDRRDLAVT